MVAGHRDEKFSSSPRKSTTKEIGNGIRPSPHLSAAKAERHANMTPIEYYRSKIVTV